MYSTNQEFHMENSDHMFVNNNQPRTRTSLNQQQQQQQQQSSSYHNIHHNTGNFGPMAINPSNTVGGSGGAHSVPFADPSTNWFSTSMDSNASSFGQSPVFGGRDLLVTPSNSTGHLIDGFAGGEDDELSQRK
jgi:transcription initiation factor TFIID subunit TAF12